MALTYAHGPDDRHRGGPFTPAVTTSTAASSTTVRITPAAAARNRDLDVVLAAARSRSGERTHRIAQLEGALHGMLLAHAVMLILVGVSITATSTGSPWFGGGWTGGGWSVLAHLPGWPWTWGLAAIALGASLIVARQRQAYRACRGILIGMSCWAVAYGVGLFAGAIVAHGPFNGVIVYLTLAALYQFHRAALTAPGLR